MAMRRIVVPEDLESSHQLDSGSINGNHDHAVLAVRTLPIPLRPPVTAHDDSDLDHTSGLFSFNVGTNSA